jgi:hypothetical protein
MRLTDEQVEELCRRMQAHPNYQRQAEEFMAIMRESPCAVCGSQDHTGMTGGHSA